MEAETTLLSDQAQSYDELIHCCRSIMRTRVSEIVAINLPFLDSAEGRVLMEEQLYGLVLQMLSYVQANSHKNRKERQREGIRAARERGVRMGRKPKYNALDYVDIFKKVDNGEIDRETARKEMGVCETTYFRLKRELKEKRLL